MRGLLVILSVSLLAAYRGGGGGSSSSCLVAAFVAAPPIIITPPTLQRRRQQFSSSSSSTRPTTTLHAEQQPNNALLSDLKNLQSKASDFVANSFNDESATSTTTSSMMMAKEELSGMNNSSGSKMLLAKRTTAPPLKVTPPPPFDPTNPEALIAITKSFIATDFGIQTSQLPNYSTAPKKKKDEAADTPLLKAINTVDSSSPLLSTTSTTNTNTDTTKPILPFYSSSLLSDTNFIWVSGNNINDGRTGILNKAEYLAAGRYFDLRSSFPDLEYRAHDFRVVVDEEGGYSSSSSSSSSLDGGDRITVRFTTLVTGTFRGSSLKLRSKVMEPNGKVMNCPPTSVSITFATAGPEKGKIVKLVTDMVMDRQIGNTQGYSGIAGAAVIAGEEPNDFTSQPPLLVLGRIFSGKLTYLDERYGEEYLPPFPDTVMIQLAKGVVASNFGLDDPDLLANEFSYLEPSMGPLNKMKYLEKFSEYGVRDAVRDMDYRIMNYRVDQYNPYRIWVDTCARGTRTGPIGDKLPKVPAANYEAPPEAMSFSFDDDGYCTRITAAAVLDPLLGNTGGLGGVNGLLYATGTPQSALKTRSLNHFLTRATKSLFSKVGLSAGADSFKMSDGRVVSGMLPFGTNGVSVGLPSTAAVFTPKPPRPPAAVLAKPKAVTPFFAAPIIDKPPEQLKAVRPAAPTKKIQTAQIIKEPAATAKPPAKEKAPIDANPQDPVTEAFSNAFGITDAQVIASSTNSESTSVNKAQELRDKAREARAEAAEAMERAAALKAQAEEEKKKMLEAKLEEQQRRLQQIEEEQKMVLEAKEAKEKEKERIQQIAEEAKTKKMQMQKKAENVSTKKKSDDEGGSPAGTMFSFLSSPPSSSKVSLKGKETTLKKSSSPKLSPTLNLFNTSSGSSKSASAKPLTKPKSQTPKSSPTLNIFSSAPKVSSSTTVKKPSPTAPSSRSPTLSLMGVGAPPKSNVVKAASKKKAPKKKSLAKNKAPVPKPSPANQSPTLSFLGIGAASTESKAASEKSSAAKSPTKKSPTLSLFGVGGGEAATDESSAAKVPAKKSPTLSVFGVGGSSQSPSSTKQTPKSSTATAAKRPTSNNAFSFFGGGNQGTSETTTKTISTAPKKLSKPDQQVPKKVEARKGTSNNVFGGFFGSSNSGSIKEEESSSVKNRKLVAKKAPKGVPVLKGWKANASNEIQGKVYSSASFRDGEKITTSPVKGRLQSGSLVISKSGSKYWLE